jgi:hypothetical protein
LKDLIEARDLFHYHLMNKKNVVATGIGPYRIRKSDPWPSQDRRDASTPHSRKSPRRTLFNSEIRPYSWPSVYVFVSEWDEEDRLSKDNPSDVVPRALYLPDGRVVPVCVIEARKQPRAEDMSVDLKTIAPRNLFGPGSAIVNEHAQGLERIATAGCIVRDGERYYLMTNRHALGKAGTEIKALTPHRRSAIGVTHELGLTREDFSDVYPHFVSSGQYLLMDVGLVDLDDITQWKTSFPGIGEVEPVLDLYDNNLTLNLIGLKVVGESAVTGRIRGEIQALFYRFKSMGGSEYLSDFLIGPETVDDAGQPLDASLEAEGTNRSFHIHHGDSGTVLMIEHHQTNHKNGKTTKSKPAYYPFALLWGKNQFIEGGQELVQPFAMATSLSTALDALDLDLVRDLNLDQEYIWGWVGHYMIGGALPVAVKLLASPKLQKFIVKNIDLLTLTPDQALGNDPRVIEKGSTDDSDPQFVQLADVPDNVWKSNVNFFMVDDGSGKKQRKPGPGSRGQHDNPNHFADMDLPYKDYATFLEFNLQNLDTNPNPQDWLDYFASVKPLYKEWSDLVGKPFREKSHWGALPFRVWQLFDLMVAAAKAKMQDEFLCLGGVLIHYVGDACQPLHTSHLSNGDPTQVVDRPQSDGKKLQADGVHSGYEDDMVNYGHQKKGLQSMLETEIARQQQDADESIAEITTGSEAAKAIIRLIAATHATLAPSEIVEKWVSLIGETKSTRTQELWNDFGDRTAVCMARGARYLAMIWQGAWNAGGGDQKIGEGAVRKPEDLRSLYEDPGFAPSVALDEYSGILKP